MDSVRATLAALHRRYDGPIDACLRDAVLTGQPRPAAWSLSLASLDIDRLALATVVARARRRASAAAAPGHGQGQGQGQQQGPGQPEQTAPDRASQDMLLWYRALGVRTTTARDRIQGRRTVRAA